jgi:DNA polymerase-3 subunit epsilon
MTWHTRRMLLLDFETTGVDPHRDRIVTAAAIAVGGGQAPAAREWLIDPVINIPAGATEVHGITTDQARAGEDASTAVATIAKIVTSSCQRHVPVVGHNIVYDLTMLHAELIRHGHIDQAAAVAAITPVVDTKVIEHHLDPFRPKEPKGRSRRTADACGSHTLVDCCRLWDVDLPAEDAHGAMADALAAGRLAWRLATQPMRFAIWDFKPAPRIDPAAMTLEQLHAWQAQEYVARAESFQSYIRGEQRGKPDVIDPDFVANTQWPVQAPPVDWTPDQLPVVAEAVTAG